MAMKQQWYKWMAATCLIVTGLLCKGWTQGMPEGQSSDFDYPPGVICENGPNLMPAFVTSPGVYPFQEVTGNVVFVNNLTGEIDLSASTPGTWTIKRVSPSDSTFRQVTITAQDLASLAYLPDTLCIASVSQLTPILLGAGGGTFSGSPNTLVINPADGVVDCFLSSPGTYAITYITPGVCPDTAVTPLTLLAAQLPLLSYPLSTFCQDTLFALPDFVHPLTGGLFSATPPGLVIDSNSGAVNLGASLPGSYLIQMDVPDSCFASIQVPFTIVAPFTGPLFVYDPDTICRGTGTVLPIVLGPNSLTFSGMVFFDNQTIGEISLSATPPGTYAISATASSPCNEHYSQTITILDSNQITLQIAGDTLFAPGPGSNFNWYLNGVLIPGATDSFLVPSTDGLYEVRYHRAGDLCGTVGTALFVGTAQPAPGIVRSQIYPQPSAGLIHYRIELSQPEAVNWQVVDLLGRVMAEGSWAKSKVQEGEIDLSHLPSGHYILLLNGKAAKQILLN